MKEVTLESEFAVFKLIHKMTILQVKIAMFYKDYIEAGAIAIPVEETAKENVLALMHNNPVLFDTLYEQAWNEYAEYLP